MAGVARKRKAPSRLGDSLKRQRISDSIQTEEAESVFGEEDVDEDEELDGYEGQSDTGDFSETEQTADTPSTPFSPSSKKAPRHSIQLTCTWAGCTKVFNRPVRLARHYKTHTNERSYTCPYEGCEKAYFEDKHLQQHIKGSHTHERPHECKWEGCGKSFMTATRLRRHVQGHEGHDRFRCTEYPPCKETFRKHQTLQRHIRSAHLELAPYICTLIDPVTNEACNAGYDGAVGLRKHQDREHGDIQFFCLQCIVPSSSHPDGSPVNLGFTTLVLLQSHIRKEHVNTVCMFCDLKCSNQIQLQKHIDSQHTNKTLEQRKNVPCTYIGCDKSFTKKSNLTTHLRTAHMGERYICGEFDVSKTAGLQYFIPEEGCEKELSSKATLEDHVRTAHLGLPSLLNSRRKNNIASKPTPRVTTAYHSDTEEEEEEEVISSRSNHKRRNAGGKKRNTAMSQLLGEDYIEELNVSATSTTRRSTRSQIAPTPVLDDPNFDWPDMGFHLENHEGPPNAYQPQPNPSAVLQPAIQNPVLPDESDLGWDLQRRVLQEGPFWIGTDQGTGDDQVVGTDSWDQDESEMRRLIGPRRGGKA